MPASAITSFFPVAALSKGSDDAVALEPEVAETSADMLRAFLGNDTLLWGCLAMALIAFATVAKVASRRRQAGKASRMARAQFDAMHSFLDAVRAGQASAKQGMWHFDFATGTQQYSENLRAVLSGIAQRPVADEQIEAMLADAGLNLAKLARDHFDETQPYEATFALKTEDTQARAMVLRACNFRGHSGEVQRVVAIISEAPVLAQA
ncbi:hypothetical protein EH31_04160 [Erythrobacter longus]|uniref:Uncharacterized protein n=1 Tax=Erythrobacter longus TaxID=1044 RepID=A0A074MJ32_ERYLO|nr:hypothetical protein [Erythrobacter longus]KEO91873.1 hypothetical protein EH31_04160 [Erythrobacter longus]